MSHKEYIKDLDEDQLRCLIEHSKSRIAQLEQSGFVGLWTVSDEDINLGWFPEDKQAEAIAFAHKVLDAAILGRAVVVEVRKIGYRPQEAERLLKNVPKI